MSTFTPFRLFTPSPILGYGYNIDEFWNAVDDQPAAIIVDAGSTDPGPYMLGTGKTLCSRQSYVRDLTPILEACATRGIKFIVSSAGGAGTNAQVDFTIDIITDIAKQRSWSFKLATIKFDDKREQIQSRERAGQIKPCSSAPPLAAGAVQRATTIVAQMGAEPFMQVLQDNTVDIIVAARSYDPAPFAAFCMVRGVEESTAWHVGKIIECGGLCAVPKGRSIVATMHKDFFELTPTDPTQRCTPVSVAAHTLYEKTRPDQLPGPGGVLHLDACTYSVNPDNRTVRVRGSRFVKSTQYEIKLEGAEHVGYRTVYIGGVRDPILIKGINEFLSTVRRTTLEAFPDLGAKDGPQLLFHVYGKNAVMGPLESASNSAYEIGVLGEVVAKSQDLADAIAGFSRTALLHGSYEDQLATGGNIASPLTPLEVSLGAVFYFSLYHLMRIENPTALFPIRTMQIGPGKSNFAVQVLQQKPRPPRRTATLQAAREPDKPASRDQKDAKDWAMHAGPVTIQKLASVVRSKNSGPFEITLDILFATRTAFDRAQRSDALTAERLRALYRLESPSDIITIMFYRPALAWKCTFKRPWPQGSIGERDTFGAQMHAPLLSLALPKDPLIGDSLRASP
ncbi:hypothetical protein M409DRAFT_61715 [Zasmidium cellare ATCC 36951]|uniref:3-methylaspartate ammonia-lyase n=1 Tax=Zasmidium cellare ATCC 36951 TaxID=1080233 RepID=A0A6A6BXU1_ZASCE|nr:uncharacterized protein M409DRAFT_61715 [Zasmidium cellare ATCC 36951]KAF2158372.1 hypothetical protein M409DRAFT_61715 [Zasmidium cellare ATCC 36951]